MQGHVVRRKRTLLVKMSDRRQILWLDPPQIFFLNIVVRHFSSKFFRHDSERGGRGPVGPLGLGRDRKE